MTVVINVFLFYRVNFVHINVGGYYQINVTSI